MTPNSTTPEQKPDPLLDQKMDKLLGLPVKISINHSYVFYVESIIELPIGIAWEDITEWYINWCKFCFTTDTGGTKRWQNVECVGEPGDADYKRPMTVNIHPVDEDDNTDWNIELGSDSI